MNEATYVFDCKTHKLFYYFLVKYKYKYYNLNSIVKFSD